MGREACSKAGSGQEPLPKGRRPFWRAGGEALPESGGLFWRAGSSREPILVGQKWSEDPASWPGGIRRPSRWTGSSPKALLFDWDGS